MVRMVYTRSPARNDHAAVYERVSHKTSESVKIDFSFARQFVATSCSPLSQPRMLNI